MSNVSTFYRLWGSDEEVCPMSLRSTGCGALMKKCVQCRASIDKMLPFIVCCGGTRKCHLTAGFTMMSKYFAAIRNVARRDGWVRALGGARASVRGPTTGFVDIVQV